MSYRNEEASDQNFENHPYVAMLNDEGENVFRNRNGRVGISRRVLPSSSSGGEPSRIAARNLYRRKLYRRRRKVKNRRIKRNSEMRNSYSRPKREVLDRVVEDFVDVIVPKMSDDEFLGSFRVSRRTMSKLQECFLISVQADNLVPAENRSDVPLSDYMMMFLWLVGGDKTIDLLAYAFGVAMEHAIYVVEVVIKFFALYEKKLIVFPESRDDALIHAKFFNQIFDIQDTIGCLFTDYLAMKVPSSKNFQSVTVQIIFDARGRVLNLHTNTSGQIHPRDMLKESRIGASLPDLCHRRFHIIADENHFPRDWLLTPFPETRTAYEIVLNMRHEEVMKGASKAWEDLTKRFYILRSPSLPHKYCSGLLVACCVLQNICMEESDDILPDPTGYISKSREYEEYLKEVKQNSAEAVNEIEDIPDLRTSGLLKRRHTSYHVPD